MTVTVQDIATRLDDSEGLKEAQVQGLINDAYALCLVYVDVDPQPDIVDVVVKNAVVRAYSNPTGVAVEQTGPYTAKFGASAATGVHLTRTERRLLKRAAGGGSAFSVDPSGPNAGPFTVWGQIPEDPMAPDPFFPNSLTEQADQ